LVANSGELDSPLKLIKIAFSQSINWRVEVKKTTKANLQEMLQKSGHSKNSVANSKKNRLVEMNL